MRSTAEGSLCFELAECLAEALVVDAQTRSQLRAGQRPWGSGHEVEQAFGKRSVWRRVWAGARGLGVEDESCVRPVRSQAQADGHRRWSRCGAVLSRELRRLAPGAQVERTVSPGVEVATASQRLAPVLVPALAQICRHAARSP